MDSFSCASLLGRSVVMDALDASQVCILPQRLALLRILLVVI
jgi:hypothetical protein